MTQRITNLECLHCGRPGHGLSGGPAESVRLSLWNSRYIQICRGCIDPDISAIFEAQVDRYYHDKARRNGG